MLDEKKYVVHSFFKYFSQYRQDPIAIYGLGNNTKLLLDRFADFHIVALMDAEKTGEVIWGLPVIDMEEAHRRKIKMILILSKAINVPIIYSRIQDACLAYQIPVFDINGKEITTAVARKKKNLPPYYQESNQEMLVKKIQQADVVSFDIFDTLLIRNVLDPTEVFSEVERKAKRLGIIDRTMELRKERIAAEHELYLETNPTIHEIYNRLVQKQKLSEIQASDLKQMEIDTEKEGLSARQQMENLVRLAKQQGKIVCCVSDMYWTKEMLEQLLHEKGFIFDHIFVSCEFRVSKCNGLYEVVRSCFPGKRILHLGDHEEADIRMAKVYGIDETFQIFSGARMAEDSAVCELLDLAKQEQDRREIGAFIATQFRDPFLFEKTGGKCRIASCYEIGYTFLEPMLTCFLDWLIEEMEQASMDFLILSARDGWIIKRMLDEVKASGRIKFQYRYVYLSRLACTLAGVDSADDIRYVAGLPYQGSVEEMLEKRFRLSGKNRMERMPGESDYHYIRRHETMILKRAKTYRKQYCDYLTQIGIHPDQRIAIFDFISSGTCQLWLENILQRKLLGLYFGRIFVQRKEHLAIKTLYEPVCVYESYSPKILENYYFMENIMSSPEPTLSCLGENGKLIFEEESRSDRQIFEMQEIHRGILDAMKKRTGKAEKGEISPAIADFLVSCLQFQYSVTEIPYFKDNRLMDSFSNLDIDIRKMM